MGDHCLLPWVLLEHDPANPLPCCDTAVGLDDLCRSLPTENVLFFYSILSYPIPLCCPQFCGSGMEALVQGGVPWGLPIFAEFSCHQFGRWLMVRLTFLYGKVNVTCPQTKSNGVSPAVP